MLFSFIGYSQSFELTPDGMIDASDPTKNYVVVDFPNTNQQDLFNKTKQFVVSRYVSAKNVMSDSSPDIISVNARADIYVKTPVGKQFYDMTYVISFAFKDNRVKVDFNIINMSFAGKSSYKMNIKGGAMSIFMKNGELRQPSTKKQIEDIANGLIEGLINNNTGQINNDW